MRAVVEVYPLPPGAAPVPEIGVRVVGVPVPVERFAGTGYARFAFAGRVVVDIAVDGPLGDWRTLPDGAVAAAEVDGSTLRLTLDEPANVVVRLADREPLFLLADAIQAPPEPHAPGVVTLTPAGDRIDTTRLQAALDAAGAGRERGTVVLAAGRHRSGTLRIPSAVTLYLAPGALLEGVADPAAYPVDAGFVESARDETLPADVRFWGRTMTFSRLLLVDDATDVRIAGRGTIAGNGRELRTRHGAVPNLIRVRRSRQVSIEDVLLRDAAAWTVHLLASEDVSVTNVRILNHRDVLNTDGIDPDMSSRVRIDRALISTKDDAICVKATGNGGLAGDVRDVLVTRCVLSSRDAALKVGTESSAARFEDVRFEDCTVFDAGRAMSVVVRDGATYERISFRRIRVDRGVDHLVEQVIGVRDPEVALGVVRGLSFEDVVAPDYTPPPSAWTWYAQFRPGRPGPGDDVPVFAGADEAHALDGLELRNVVVTGRRLVDAGTARDVAGLTIGPFVRNVRFE